MYKPFGLWKEENHVDDQMDALAASGRCHIATAPPAIAPDPPQYQSRQPHRSYVILDFTLTSTDAFQLISFF